MTQANRFVWQEGDIRVIKTCPKEVKVRYVSHSGQKVQEQVRCNQPLSPGYAHCNDHIKDKEFFERKEKEMPSTEIQSLILQIVGVEKAIKFKGKDLAAQRQSLRLKFGNAVKAQPNFGDRMNAQKALKQARVRAQVEDLG